MGGVLTKVLRENSAFMFPWVPWWFDFQYRLFMNFAPTRWLARTLLTLFGRRGLKRLIKAHDPDLIVSTYPGVTAVLGELRRKGRLDVPCYSSITDLAGLHFWAHPGSTCTSSPTPSRPRRSRRSRVPAACAGPSRLPRRRSSPSARGPTPVVRWACPPRAR